MTCEHSRELISARIDDEHSPADTTELDTHVGACASCTAYQNEAFALRRALRMRAVEPLSSSARAGSEPTVDVVGYLKTVSAMRWVLFVIGGTLVILNLVSIVSPDAGASAHLTRHNGIFGTALGIGMLAVAAKPHRAMGLLPLTSTIAVLMAVAAGADLVSGQVNLLSEAVHVVEFAGLICLWVISGGPSRLPKYVAHITVRLPQLPSAPQPRTRQLQVHPETV